MKNEIETKQEKEFIKKIDKFTMENKKAQFFAGLALIFIAIFVVSLIVYLLTLPKQNPSNINTIILQNNSNNTTPIQERNLTNITTIKSKPYDEYRNLTLYPDRRLVKGSILTTNKSVICVSGYSSTVRNVPVSVRKHVFYDDGVPYPPNKSTDYELDHFYSLEIGGSNAETNLFVESAPYYHWKDTVENLVHDKMCNSNMTVETATGLMWIWYDIYRNKSIVDDYINE